MDSSKYTDKYLDILKTEQLLKHDATKSIENKIRLELRKLKTRLEYKTIGSYISQAHT